MKEEIKKIIDSLENKIPDNLKMNGKLTIRFELPPRKEFGDLAMVAQSVEEDKKISHSSPALSQWIAGEIKKNPNFDKYFKDVKVVHPFINFFIADKYFVNVLKNIDKDFGKNSEMKNKKIILDYTDPNPFKEFHIGHLMTNAIGESLSRIFEFEGAKVKRACYQGDVGIHVAKAIWGKMHNPNLTWGEAYAFGAQKYEADENAKKEIVELNKKIYERSDAKINKLYDAGKKESLKHFDKIYKKLGTKFDYLIFESEAGPVGKKIVENNLGKVFEKGENGAVIFRGEKFGLHTRVFINSAGLPTYEAKDLGLAEIKYKKFPYDMSFAVAANEINEYFKVMLCAMKQVLPNLAEKTKHIGHGMLKLPEGKMSSRTGKIITGESLIEKVEELVKEKIKDRNLSKAEKAEISEKVAIGAIKYSILKQSTGSDIIYDFDKSISFEGDSGPYLQYAYTRANSVLEKAKKEKISARGGPAWGGKVPKISELEKKISYFPEIIEKAGKEYEPHFLVLYLTELAGIFNNYYAKNKIVDKKDENSPYRVALTAAFAKTMKNGLWLLGINALEKM